MSFGKVTRTLVSLSAVACLLLAALPAMAQTPRIRPDARGFETTRMIQNAMRTQVSRTQAPSPVIPTPTYRPSSSGAVGVTVDVPTVTETVSAPGAYITIRGPDGELRRFPLARGVEVQYRRQQFVLRPGESTTIRVTPSPAPAR